MLYNIHAFDSHMVVLGHYPTRDLDSASQPQSRPKSICPRL